MLRRLIFVIGVLSMVAAVFSGCATIKGEMYLAGEKYDQAIPIFQEILAKSPNDINARSKLGFAYLKTGRIDEAITELEAVQKAKPGEPYSTLYLGMAYANKERLGDAIEIWKGYKDDCKPIVEAEVKRQLTLLLIAHSQRQAKKALETEKSLKTVKPDDSTVAVCYYQDLSPDKSLSAFQKGLAAMIITDMSKIKSLKVVERLRLQALLEEMRMGQTGIVDARTAPRVGRLLGAENLVVGSIMIGSYKVTTSLSSTTAGGVRGTAQVTVPQDQFYELPKQIVTQSAAIIGVSLSPDEQAALAVPQTKSFKAVTFYGQALEALDAGKWENAKELFTLALKEDPNFLAARAGAAGCPDASAPSKGALQSMTTKAITQTVEAAVDAATAEQGEADAAGEGGSGEGGGGGGGGGSGGGGGGY